ncbi:hypothetical protein J437_LFUL006544 [Ladona fulva]|uniref:Uncharacterized protein n=1 Tax=Ladona fulva TaxID=123851 RepID=A0A8K0KIQ3_LADFU|nr:hypothetical protein J437_LFUL006544 [Ladona fulva]
MEGQILRETGRRTLVFKTLSLEEALRILAEDEESEVDVTDVFISPPEGNELTNEDSADEDWLTI